MQSSACLSRGKKTAGGETVTRVGFELLHRTRQLGISSRRTEWIVRWTAEVAATSKVHLRSLEKWLGQVMYLAWALEYERPFLAPLYRFTVLHPRDSVWPGTAYVAFFLRFVSHQLRATRHYDCAAELHPDQVSPRVDAQASSQRTGIGGWFPLRDSSGNLDTMSSHWFLMEIREEHWPWVFARGSKPARVISTLEALVVLVAVMLYFRDENRAHRSSIKVIPTVTDNRGIGAALNKLMTTKHPASAVGRRG